MKVEHWCNSTVVAAEPDVGLRELAELMEDYGVSQVVVVREIGTLITPIGIITERDLALRSLTSDAEAGTLTARDIMSRQLLTVFDHDEVDSALAAMRTRGVQRAPVVDEEGALVGILLAQEVLASMANMVVDLFTHRDGAVAGKERESGATLYTLPKVPGTKADPDRIPRFQDDGISFDYRARSKLMF